MATRVEHFSALVERQPANELFRFSLAQALVAEGRKTDAVEQFQRCVAQKPDWMMAHILLGKLLLDLQLRDQARASLQIAHRLAVEQNHDDPERELRALLADL